MNYTGSKRLKTERLTLRPFCESDAEAMFENWAGDKEVTKYLTWMPHENVEQTRMLLRLWEAESKEKNRYHWAIEYEGEVVGDIALGSVIERDGRGILGYCLSRKCWGKGIMTEALKEVIRYLFEEVGFFRLEATYSDLNPASGRVMEKCGLFYEGTFRKYVQLLSTGERTDIIQRAILREDYFARK